ncbi:MAG: response regulator [Candidatus Yonathbacteria bacterium]|nr:response regulator [Candidatus Yonathbacteria bacterium]
MESRKKKLLLIDDNEIVRLMFSNVFWLHRLDDKYELTTVGRIEEALVFIENPATRPDIIFMGLVMPFVNNGKTETSAEAGFSMLKRIKNDPQTKAIRIVIFSSYNEEEYREKALALGAEMYLKKDENMPQDILKIINSFDTDASHK